jgi:uncharacterized repeat protein (TIGR01451 family)
MLRVALSRSLVVALVLALGLVFVQPKGVSAAATLTLNPTTGPAGTVVTVTGSGYGASLPVRIYFGNLSGSVLVATTTASAAGEINASFTVPAVPPNTYTVAAISTAAQMTANFTVTNAPAPTITVNPTSGAPGTVVTLTGSGFGANELAAVYFNGVLQGTFTTTASGTLPTGTTFTVPNIAAGTYNVTVITATRTASTTFTVGAAPAGLTVAKFVTVNGLGYSTTGNARPGDTLTYQIQITNQTGASLSGVTLTDTLAAGQTLVAETPFACTVTGSTVSCPIGTVANNSQVNLFISTVVNSTFSGQIANQAGVTSAGGPSATSNTTLVTVASGVPFIGNFSICGPVTAYTAAGAANGSITVSGVTLTIAAGSTASGVVLGTNECILATVNSAGQLTAIVGTVNLSGLSVACGIYTVAATGYVNAAGVQLVVAPGATFMGSLIVGTSYCFILNASGQVIGAVVGFPTRAILPLRHHPYWWERVGSYQW